MSLFDNSDIVLDVVLKFSDPFDMMNVLRSNRIYSQYINDDTFWHEAYQRRYGSRYQGNDPRSAFIAGFFGQHTKIKNMNPKYHWLAYLMFFSGDIFLSEFDVINTNDVDINMRNSSIREYVAVRYSYVPEELYPRIIQDLELGYNPVLKFEQDGNHTYIGTLQNLDPYVLFSLRDPLDIELWLFGESMDVVNFENIISQLDPHVINALGFNIPSIWEPLDIFPASISDFINIKVQEAINTNVRETISELVQILKAVDPEGSYQ